MKVHDDFGWLLNAKFSVQNADGATYLILESRGGGAAKRNPDYQKAFSLLMSRLGRMNARLVSIELYSRPSLTWALGDRLVAPEGYSLPLLISGIVDIEEFRLATARASKILGSRSRSPSKGSPHRRLRFGLHFPEFATLSVTDIERRLAHPPGSRHVRQVHQAV